MELGRLPEGVAHTRVASLRPTIVGARYELINLLAEGLMGSVHRALDRLTGHIVTLKHLRADSPSTPDSPWDSRGYRLLLAQEFRLLSSLRHPNIVSVLDYGFDDDRLPYFTMDLEEGGVPLTLAGAGQPLNVQVELLVQTLRAIAYLHRHGIIHRDLKPDNIIVVGSQVKVLDFGLSTSRQAVARNEAGWGGTVSYMAPEVLRGEPPSERCDLYSFGMVALELLSWSQAVRSEEAVGAVVRHETRPDMHNRSGSTVAPWNSSFRRRSNATRNPVPTASPVASPIRRALHAPQPRALHSRFARRHRCSKPPSG